MKLFMRAVMVSLFMLSACSQATEAPSQEVVTAAEISSVKTGNWIVNPAESHIQFTSTQQGESFTGEFGVFEAVINFDPEAVEQASVTATIDLSSVSVGDKDRDGALPGKEWFYTKKFPKAVFISNDFVMVSEGQYESKGMLTMKGKAQELTLPFTLNLVQDVANMTGKVTLDRTLWEVGTGAWATDEWVSTEVVIDIKIQANSR